MTKNPRLHHEFFKVPADFALPDLAELDGVDSVDTTAETVEETHYDTADGHLERFGITLQKRRGGNPGWRLQLPPGPETDVLMFESRATSAPREVSMLLTGVRGGQRLTTTRKLVLESDTHQLIDAAGETLAVVRDDRTRLSSPVADSEDLEWRSVRVVPGPAAAKAAIKELRKSLRDAGARPTVPEARARRSPSPSRETTPLKGLVGLVDDYVQTQLTAIALGDLGLRRGVDLVHETRVGVRRLRSTLHVFARVFDDARAMQLDTELAWFSAHLGRIRDLDVAAARVSADLAELPEELVPETLAEQFEAEVMADRSEAVAALDAVMASRRYLVLVSLLDQWRYDPPYKTSGGSVRRKAVDRYVAGARKALRRRLATAAKPGAEPEQVHRARRAAKRLRYAAELAQPVLGTGGSTFKQARGWQRRLGEYQDCSLAADLLVRLGSRSESASAATGFTYGVLMARELDRREVLHAALRRSLR